MTAPTRPVPTEQQVAFELAVAERLGIDPESALAPVYWRIEDGRAFVQLKHVLDPDELLEMWNTGKADLDGVTIDFTQPEPSPVDQITAIIFGTGYTKDQRAQVKRSFFPLLYNGDLLTSETALAAFREAWEQADREGVKGDRVRRGMVAAIEAVS